MEYQESFRYIFESITKMHRNCDFPDKANGFRKSNMENRLTIIFIYKMKTNEPNGLNEQHIYNL